MLYPKLRELATGRQMVSVFKGYNHNLRISDGEFFDMKNMTSDYFPVLAPRGKRGMTDDNLLKINSGTIIAKDSLCYVDGAFFCMTSITDESVSVTPVDMGLSTAEDMLPKRLVSMGAYVIIMPDKMYINTQNTNDRGSIEKTYVSTGDVKFDLCDAEGNIYSSIWKGGVTPETTDEDTVWIETSVKPYTLYGYSAATEAWVPITPYTRMSAEGIGKDFAQGEGVIISGVVDDSRTFLNGNVIVQACGDDYIVVEGLAWRSGSQTLEEGAITVARKMPDMDFIVESGNRLWGCRYGTALNGEMVNEIYASKLGDFKNWNCFSGISTDSYAASCGTDGPFTGAVTYIGHPLFFKENWIHKVYGNYPASFQIQTTACRGVQEGCGRSLAFVNETLFYKSHSGILAYDGSLPVDVSYALGSEVYSDAVAGGHGNKYYVSMKDKAGAWHLFVYDVEKQMWHKEDNFHADSFCSLGGELYAVEHDSGQIVTMLGSGIQKEERVSWMAETGPIGTDMPDMKYISRMIVRMSMEIGSRVRFLVQYDSAGAWEHLCTLTGRNLRSFNVPIRPRRCDHLRLRIMGEGEARIYSITKTIEEGSDIS